jgi:hypothetical protein
MSDNKSWFKNGAVQAAIVAGIIGLIPFIYSISNNDDEEKAVSSRLMNEKHLTSIILGKWQEVRSEYNKSGGLILIKHKEHESSFEMLNLSPEDETKVVDEVKGEFDFSSTSKHHFVGRHMWNGSKVGKPFWSKYADLSIDIIDDKTFRLIYHDSKYTNGWLYKKIAN